MFFYFLTHIFSLAAFLPFAFKTFNDSLHWQFYMRILPISIVILTIALVNLGMSYDIFICNTDAENNASRKALCTTTLHLLVLAA